MYVLKNAYLYQPMTMPLLGEGKASRTVNQHIEPMKYPSMCPRLRFKVFKNLFSILKTVFATISAHVQELKTWRCDGMIKSKAIHPSNHKTPRLFSTSRIAVTFAVSWPMVQIFSPIFWSKNVGDVKECLCSSFQIKFPNTEYNDISYRR